MSKSYKNWLDNPSTAFPRATMQGTNTGVVPVGVSFFGSAVMLDPAGQATYNDLLNRFGTGIGGMEPYSGYVYESESSPGYDPGDPALRPDPTGAAPNYGFFPSIGYSHPFPILKWPKDTTEDSSLYIGASRSWDSSTFRYRYARPGTYRVYEFVGTGTVRGQSLMGGVYSQPLARFPEPYTPIMGGAMMESPGYWRQSESIVVLGVNFSILPPPPSNVNAGSSTQVLVTTTALGEYDGDIIVSISLAPYPGMPGFGGTISPANITLKPGQPALFTITAPITQRTSKFALTATATAFYVIRRSSATFTTTGKDTTPPPPPDDGDDSDPTGRDDFSPVVIDSARGWLHEASGQGKRIKTRNVSDWSVVQESPIYPVDYWARFAVDPRTGILWALGNKTNVYSLYPSRDGGMSLGNPVMNIAADANAMQVDSPRGSIVEIYSNNGGQIYQRQSKDPEGVEWEAAVPVTYKATPEATTTANLSGKPKHLAIDDRSVYVLSVATGTTTVTVKHYTSTDAGKSWILRDP